MTGRLQQTCQVCGSSTGFVISDDGFYYCCYCNSQAEDMMDTGVDVENIINHYSATQSRSQLRPVNVLNVEPISQIKGTPSHLLDHPYITEDYMDDEYEQIEPTNIGSSQNNLSYDDYYTTTRSRYLTGLQVMIQLQCQALVEKFNVSPLIVGLVGPIWLRFLASSRIMADEWADQVLHDSETQTQAFWPDLSSYLQYCKDVVFSGLQPSFEDLAEEKLMEEFWEFFRTNKALVDLDHQDDSGHASRPLMEFDKDERIRQLKLDMEENKFCYVPPRTRVRRKDYLHYVRKRKEVYIYAVHADYYILLRSCAKVAQVETRIMHLATLNLERRLKCLEKRIDFSLNLRQNPKDVCDFCRDEPAENHDDDSTEQNR